MGSFGRVAVTLGCAVVIASTTGVAAASAADRASATAVTATLQGSQLRVAWTHSARALMFQSVDVSESSTGEHIDLETVAPDATWAALDTGDIGLLGGYSYSISVVSIYSDPATGPMQSRSDAVAVTLPEVASATPAEAPTCSIDAQSRLLTIAVPATDSHDVYGSHTITDRTVSVLKNSKPWKTLTVPGAAAANATVTVPYDPRPGRLVTDYSASYSVGSAAGSSGSTGDCAASLTTPTPKHFIMTSTHLGDAVSVAWAKATSVRSPMTSYTVSWQLDSQRMRTKSMTVAAARSFSLPVGAARRVRVDVVAVNKLGGSMWQGVVWQKNGTRWTQGTGR